MAYLQILSPTLDLIEELSFDHPRSGLKGNFLYIGNIFIINKSRNNLLMDIHFMHIIKIVFIQRTF